ncbi:hypothetical protein ACFQYP_48655 [Nonomuraea antimicrobica]
MAEGDQHRVEHHGVVLAGGQIAQHRQRTVHERPQHPHDVHAQQPLGDAVGRAQPPRLDERLQVAPLTQQRDHVPAQWPVGVGVAQRCLDEIAHCSLVRRHTAQDSQVSDAVLIEDVHT